MTHNTLVAGEYRRVARALEECHEDAGAGRVGHRPAQPGHHVQPRSNSQHALTIQNLLTSRVWLPLLISA